MSTTKKNVTTKPAKKTTAKKPAAKRHPTIKLTDHSLIIRIGDRKKGGPKTKLLDLIPKSGVTVQKLTVAAKKAELPVAKVARWIKFLRAYNYVDVRAGAAS